MRELLGNSNLQVQMLSDKIANEIMQCSVVFFNDRQEYDSDDNFDDNLNKTIELVKLAKSIAISSQVKDKATENIETLLKMKDREIQKAIALLQSIKVAYEKACKEIDKQVSELMGGDDILNRILIDWDKVKRLKRNALDWDHVNEFLKDGITDKSLKRIKLSSDTEKKEKFLNLLYWLKEHSQSDYLVTRIINKYKKIPPKLPFTILSSTITNTDNKPLYTKFIRYIGIKLKVEVKENAKITFYLKYIDPDGYLDSNKKSPKGYTMSDTITLTKGTEIIAFPAWGNANECTYEIGENRIEIYVDEYLIHTKKFMVDLAPSDKIKKELNKLTKELENVKNTIYYKSEIDKAKLELEEIQKFKLFRTKSTKLKQIEEQQTIINNYIEKGNKEKTKRIRELEEKIYELRLKLKSVKY